MHPRQNQPLRPRHPHGSHPLPRIATCSGSRSAPARSASCGRRRICCGTRFRPAITPSSSIARSPSWSISSSARSSRRLGACGPWSSQAEPTGGTSPRPSGAKSGRAMVAVVRLKAHRVAAARPAGSSSITSCHTRMADRPTRRISHCDAGRTTHSRASSCSGRFGSNGPHRNWLDSHTQRPQTGAVPHAFMAGLS